MLNFNLCNLLKVTNTILTSVFFIIYTVSASAESLNLKETESLSFTNTLFEYFDENNLHLIKHVPDALEFGFDPSIDLNGETILHRAISFAKYYEGCALWNDYLKALNSLVCSGIDINVKYNTKTPIELSVDLFLIAKMDENRYAINELHLAQILEPFLLAGFDPQSVYKITPHYMQKISFFDIFDRYGYKAVTDLIIGDNSFQGNPFYDWDLSNLYKRLQAGQDFRNYTLMQACPLEHLGYSAIRLSKIQRERLQTAVMILLENGFESIGIGDENNTPLHQAASLGNKEVIDLLMKNGAIVDLEKKNAEGFTPLMLAAFGRRAESFSCLVHYGADLNIIVPKTNLSLKHYIQYGQFKDFFTDLRCVYRGMEAIRLIMY